jgi:hypothetical protein
MATNRSGHRPVKVAQDIRRRGAIPGPSGAGAAGQITAARPGGGPARVPGDGTGWAREPGSNKTRLE